MPDKAKGKTGTIKDNQGQGRDKQRQAGTNRDMVGTSKNKQRQGKDKQGQAGTSNDKQGQAGTGTCRGTRDKQGQGRDNQGRDKSWIRRDQVEEKNTGSRKKQARLEYNGDDQ